MKTSSLILLCTLIFTSTYARENPFEPTQTYNDELAKLYDGEMNYPQEFQKKNKPELEDMTSPKTKALAKTQEELEAEAYAKKVAQENIKKAKELERKKKLAEEKSKKEAILKEAEKLAIEKAKKNPMIYVKLREDIVVDKTLDVLPFLKVSYTNDEVKIDSKHEVFKKFYLPKERKLILDFRADTSFYTKHYNLESKYFKKLSVGNHKEDRYFRVVILLDQDTKKYSVRHDNNLVLISFNKEMI